MHYNGLLLSFPKEIKIFIAAFVVILSIGFFTGLLFVSQTSTTSPNGIVENYNGNEEDEDAEVMKFKKSEREMLTIVHTHILSMSFIFFLLGGLVWLTKLSKKLKLFLTVEPFVSVVLTFGGIYFLWTGLLWMKYVVAFSGFLMTATFTISAILVLYQLTLKPAESN
ncbi:hypothetical protein FEE95_19425 [Maribacter algarum]|uniref:Uncharacterized protein n=1 Tax=Maribacter algarum (ex Zhang et al. 2020) TaxID=2578118 RepID=A0A5S3PGH8_9FLAO|nr:hypothetical protein [Maribacter algarum]TMM53240.1 hypothetical protein FEE95_19425 [Maribacter algarum]